MNKRSIDTARDPDLRLSYQALLRAAQRARAVALQTGTPIVIGRNGVVEHVDPATGKVIAQSVQSPAPSYGGN
jgi:hypothetical protein